MSVFTDSGTFVLPSGQSEPDVERFGQAFDEWEVHWHQKIGTLGEASVRNRTTLQFSCEITGIRFRGLSEVPVLILGDRSPEVRAALRPFIAMTPAASLGVIVCLTASAFAFVRNSPVLPPARFVVLSPEEAAQLRDAESPVDFLRRKFLEQIPYHRLIPYSISEPTEGGMFVGREHELNMLMYQDQDFLLCGEGGVGKTSLLRQMQWQLRRQRDPRAKRLVEVVWLNCPADLDSAANVLAKAVIPSLRAQEVTCTTLAAFLKRIHLSDSRFEDGPIDLIIDETDEILSLDRRTVSGGHNYPLMRQLRTARLQGSIRMTLSGRKETSELLNSADNPFSLGTGSTHRRDVHNRFRSLVVGPLSNEEARRLLTIPLRDSNYPIDQHAVTVEQRLREAGGIPVNLQSAGLDLASAVTRGR